VVVPVKFDEVPDSQELEGENFLGESFGAPSTGGGGKGSGGDKKKKKKKTTTTRKTRAKKI